MRPVVTRLVLAAALGTAVLGAQAPASSMPDGQNVILGRVTEMDAPVPVGGAIVTLTGHFDSSGRPATPDPAMRSPGLPPSVNVMTTPDGYFVVRGLPAGLFTAAVRAFGYLNDDFPPTVIDVRDSQKPTEVALRLWKYAALGGHVVDERGEPLAGVPVSALRRVLVGAGVMQRRVATVLTDDRGEYRLAQLAPGEYTTGVLATTTTLPAEVAAALDPSAAGREGFLAMSAELRQSGFLRTWGCDTCIRASHEGQRIGDFVLQRPGLLLPPAPDGRPLGFASTFYPGTTSPGNAGLVSLGSGESRTDLDFSVQLGPTVAVAGTLVGPDGPMPHVSLSLAPPGADLGDFDPPGVASAITDSRGAFAFLGVAPDDYVLSASTIFDLQESVGDGRPFWLRQALAVGDEGLAGLTVAMQPGIRISGRVEFREVSAAARPAGRQVLSLQPIGAQLWRTVPIVVRPDGTFRSAGDPPGRYVVYAGAPPGWFWQTTTLAGRPLPDGIIELGASEVADLVLTFGRTTNRVSGLVSDSSGSPAADAAVIVFPADSDVWRDGVFTTRRARKVRTTSAGAYEVTTLAPGEYFVVAVDVRQALNWQDPRLLARLMPGASRFSLGAEDQRTVALRTLTIPGIER